jgi:hypothetical protein
MFKNTTIYIYILHTEEINNIRYFDTCIGCLMHLHYSWGCRGHLEAVCTLHGHAPISTLLRRCVRITAAPQCACIISPRRYLAECERHHASSHHSTTWCARCRVAPPQLQGVLMPHCGAVWFTPWPGGLQPGRWIQPQALKNERL